MLTPEEQADYDRLVNDEAGEFLKEHRRMLAIMVEAREDPASAAFWRNQLRCTAWASPATTAQDHHSGDVLRMRESSRRKRPSRIPQARPPSDERPFEKRPPEP